MTGAPTRTAGSPAQVVYKKNGSYNGPDDFKYAVRQASSQFPLQPGQRSR